MDGFRIIWIQIDAVIYVFLSSLFDFFSELGKFELFGETIGPDGEVIDVLGNIGNRLSVLFGLVAIGLVVFHLIKVVISPKSFKGTKDHPEGFSDIIKRVIIALILLITTPFIFRLVYRVQSVVIENDIIGNLTSGTREEQNVFGEEILINAGSNTNRCRYVAVNGDETISFVIERDLYEKNPEAFEVFDGHLKAPDKDYLLNKEMYTHNGCPEKVWKYGGVGAARVHYRTHAIPSSIGIEFDSSEYKLVSTELLEVGYLGEATGSYIYSVGRKMAMDLFTGFFYLENNVPEDVRKAYDRDVKSATWDEFKDIVWLKNHVNTYYVNYSFILSTIVGLYAIVLMASCLLDLGFRVVKLAFYQLVAPFTFISYISEGTEHYFFNWLRVFGSTFMEIFIRLISLNFIMYVFKTMSFNKSGTGIIISIFVIFGLLKFLKDGPGYFASALGLTRSSNVIGDITGFIKEKLKKYT